jgi:hypothetical protein
MAPDAALECAIIARRRDIVGVHLPAHVITNLRTRAFRRAKPPETRHVCDTTHVHPKRCGPHWIGAACSERDQAMFDLLRDLWGFMRERKKFWLAPIIVVMLLLGALIVLAQGSAVAPFIYTLF